MNEGIPIKRALLSVADKIGVIDLAWFLAERGVEILSTGGTSRLLREHGIAVAEVSDYTSFPEIMDGRLKTLHPKVHGGLLGRRGHDTAVMSEHGIKAIDLLVVNLYPFEQTVSRADVAFEKVIENIDVGGPAMIRAASKNHERVAVVVDPEDYASVMREMRDNDDGVSRALRSKLAAKAFESTAMYDIAISEWLERANSIGDDRWPAAMRLSLKRVSQLRYGENPHQAAAFYTQDGSGLAGAEQLQGKALSYNNLADASAAYECVCGFEETACVVVKHANPCGAACADSLAEAYRRAVKADPMSAFGGVIAFNRTLDPQTASEIVEGQFAELVIAPEIEKDAFAVLSGKAALRVMACSAPDAWGHEYRSVLGGVLVQESDREKIGREEFKVATKRAPDESETKVLLFAWRVVKFVKSNAIVFACDGATVGIGAGQTSRIGSVRVAALESHEHGVADKPLVMASEAFFPFRDGIDAAVEAGVTAVIQPGGSIHDDKVIVAADEHGIAMVFTGVRHFRH